MISATFSAPPTTQKNATLYQHAQEVIRVVSQAKQTLESLDNHDQLDINRLPGDVVIDTAYPVATLTPKLAAAFRETPVHYLTGQIQNGEMKADLTERTTPEFYDSKASYQETATEKIYQLSTPSSEHSMYHPGTVTVRQNKANGTLIVDQAKDFPWQLNSTYCNTTAEGIYPPTGPQSSEDAPLYRAGQELKSKIDQLINQAKALDNGPQDLNPQTGTVVTTGLATTYSNNLIHDYMAGSYHVPMEAQLTMDSNGQVLDFSAGFGDKATVIYHQDPHTGSQSYRSDGFVGCASLDIQPDGGQIVRHYDQTGFSFDTPLFQKESTIDSGFFSHLKDIGAGTIAAGGATGAIGAGIAATIAGLAVAPLAAIAVAGALTGSAINHLCFKKVELNQGVNRFQGANPEERFAAANYAHQHREVGKYGEIRHHWEFGQEGMGRQESLKIIDCCQRIPAYGHLSILTQQLGKEGEPAVVLIPTDSAYPVRNGETGLVLPGNLTIPYTSIRGIIDWSV